jgi:hypothetical protein
MSLGHTRPHLFLFSLHGCLEEIVDPIRGALQGLQREGYVIEHNGKLKSRMMVAPLTHEDAREILRHCRQRRRPSWTADSVAASRQARQNCQPNQRNQLRTM